MQPIKVDERSIQREDALFCYTNNGEKERKGLSDIF